jgi:hypothetical protein
LRRDEVFADHGLKAALVRERGVAKAKYLRRPGTAIQDLPAREAGDTAPDGPLDRRTERALDNDLVGLAGVDDVVGEPPSTRTEFSSSDTSTFVAVVP